MTHQTSKSPLSLFIMLSLGLHIIGASLFIIFAPKIQHTQYVEIVLQTSNDISTTSPRETRRVDPSPVAQAPTTPPVAQAPVTPPVAQAPVTPPIAQAPATPPIAQAPATPPVAQAPVTPPVAQAPVTPPVAQTPVTPPVAQAPVTPPVAQAPVTPPVAQTPVTPPVAQAPVTPPVAQTPVTPPVAPAPVTPPVAQTPPTPVVQQTNKIIAQQPQNSTNSVLTNTNKDLSKELDQLLAQKSSSTKSTDELADATWSGAPRKTLSFPNIVIPEQYNARGYGFSVTAKITFSQQGWVSAVELTQGSGDPRIDSIFRTELRKIRVEPTQIAKSETITKTFKISVK